GSSDAFDELKGIPMKHVLRTTLTLVVLASLATMAPANQTHKHKAIKPKPKPVRQIALEMPAPDLGPMVGTWTLRDGEKPRTDIKMVFRNNGTFAFLGPNWKSTGKFRVAEHTLSLEWTSIDGSKVAPGTVKKDFSMADDDGSFTIDKYTYYKLGR
ncbi:MAG TPA: hypothetical protein VG820_05350, partial [Fimbriimonadaceae bacterium]|nr:hypothetical protein [Fimbriimonadaceae bacterium]